MSKHLKDIVSTKPRPPSRRFKMQDRSGGRVNRTDEGLTLQAALQMTDYTDDEVDSIVELAVGEELLMGDISIERTS